MAIQGQISPNWSHISTGTLEVFTRNTTMTGNTGIKYEGFRTLPTALEQKVADDPNGTYAIVPKTHDLGDGFRYITNHEVLKAVDSMALWLEETFGRSEKFETLAYVGVTDIRYALFFHAAVKAGYKVI